MAALGPSRRVTFGQFEFDLLTGELRKADRPVRLGDQSEQVLRAMLERAGDLVTRNELRERLWPGDTLVDFEHGLNSAVRRLRDALGDSADRPKFIETVPRKGYRFIAAVSGPPQETADTHDAAATEPPPSEPHISPPPEAGRKPSRSWIALAALVAALALYGTTVALRTDAKVAADPPLTPVRLTHDDGLQADPVFSPDGQSVLYAANVSGRFDIWRRPVSGGSPTRITEDDDDEWQPDWSPDGEWVAFRSERDGGGIYVAPINGGGKERLADFGFRPIWSPDSKTIVFARSIVNAGSVGLHVVSRSSPARPVAQAQAGAFGWLGPAEIIVLRCFAGAFNPTAKSIDTQGGEIGEWEVDPGVARRFLEAKVAVAGDAAIRWVPQESAIFFIGDVHGFRSVWRIGVDAATRRVIDGPRPVTSSIEATSFSITGDGRRLAFGESQRAARLWSYALDSAGNLQESSRTPLTAKALHSVAPDLGRDGSRLLYALARPASRQQRELITRDLSTGEEQTRQVLNEDHGAILFPRWSRDRKRLSYTRVTRITAEQQIVILDLAKNQESALTSPVSVDKLEQATDWTLDDRFLISSSTRYRQGQTAITMLRVADAPSAERTARIITATEVGSRVSLSQPSMSPDRRWVVFRAGGMSGPGTARLAVVSAEGGDPSAWTFLTPVDVSADKPRWSTDGATIYFTASNGGIINLWSIPFDCARGRPAGAPRRQTAFTGPAEQLLPDIGPLEIGIAKNRAVLPIVQQTGAVWVIERQP